jgi:hypothetical protein
MKVLKDNNVPMHKKEILLMVKNVQLKCGSSGLRDQNPKRIFACPEQCLRCKMFINQFIFKFGKKEKLVCKSQPSLSSYLGCRGSPRPAVHAAEKCMRRPSRDFSRYAAFLCTHCAYTLYTRMCYNR